MSGLIRKTTVCFTSLSLVLAVGASAAAADNARRALGVLGGIAVGAIILNEAAKAQQPQRPQRQSRPAQAKPAESKQAAEPAASIVGGGSGQPGTVHAGGKGSDPFADPIPARSKGAFD